MNASKHRAISTCILNTFARSFKRGITDDRSRIDWAALRFVLVLFNACRLGFNVSIMNSRISLTPRINFEVQRIYGVKSPCYHTDDANVTTVEASLVGDDVRCELGHISDLASPVP